MRTQLLESHEMLTKGAFFSSLEILYCLTRNIDMPVDLERLGATRLGTNLELIYWTLDGLHQVTWPQTA